MVEWITDVSSRELNPTTFLLSVYYKMGAKFGTDLLIFLLSGLCIRTKSTNGREQHTRPYME